MAFKYSKTAKKTKEESSMGGHVFEHPAFGVVQISRITGDTTLFQSELKHTHFIRVRVFKAKKRRSLHSDWVAPSSNPLIEFDMSEAQYASMVSSISLGTGTPITITRGPDEEYKPVSYPHIINEDTTVQFKEEMEDTLSKFTALSKKISDDMDTLLEGKTVKKSDLKEIRAELYKLSVLCPSNVKFAQDMFKKHMETVTESAKAEINGYMLKTLQDMGLDTKKKELGVGDLDGNGHVLPATIKNNKD